jgi:hypothetical protein
MKDIQNAYWEGRFFGIGLHFAELRAADEEWTEATKRGSSYFYLFGHLATDISSQLNLHIPRQLKSFKLHSLQFYRVLFYVCMYVFYVFWEDHNQVTKYFATHECTVGDITISPWLRTCLTGAEIAGTHMKLVTNRCFGLNCTQASIVLTSAFDDATV